MSETSKGPLPEWNSLPDEILIHIISYLDPRDIAHGLHRLDKRVRRLSRHDKTFWRRIAYQIPDEAANHHMQLNAARPTRSAAPADNGSTQHASAQAATSSSQSPPVSSADRPLQVRPASYTLLPASDHSIDFYHDYVFRTQPVLTLALEAPERQDVRGIAVFSRNGVQWESSNTKWSRDLVLSPLDGGTVCIFDLNKRRRELEESKHDDLLATSAKGLLGSSYPSKHPHERTRGSCHIVNCVTVDQFRQRGYFAVESHLIEVDLVTLKKVAVFPFPFSITALSDITSPTLPMTVGTSLMMHLHDPRIAFPENMLKASFDPNGSPDRDARIDPPHIHDHLSRALEYIHPPQPAMSILHSEDEIYIAGRSPSVLVYSRRTWPKILGTIFSGGRLADMTMFPTNPINQSNGLPTKSTLVAAGEYSGRGSLELYPIPIMSSDSNRASMLAQFLKAPDYGLRNRQTASRGKLLSVELHGSRLVYGDVEGCVRWTERDGRSLIRHHDVQLNGSHNASARQRPERRGALRWVYTPDGDVCEDVILKICTTQPNNIVDAGEMEEFGLDKLVLWTGDRIATLGIRSAGEERLQPDRKESTKSDGQPTIEERASEYDEQMRLALERHTDDIRLLNRLRY